MEMTKLMNFSGCWKMAAASLMAALTIAGFSPSPAAARTGVNISVNVGGAPYAPRFQVYHAPRMVLVPGSPVYYATDYDNVELYQVGSSWYACDGTYWYRASDYRGPWRSVRSVPREVFYVHNGD